MATRSQSVATLRVTGDALDPDDITRLLGAPPSESHKKGARGSVGPNVNGIRSAESGMWQLQATADKQSNLDEQIKAILGRLTDDLGIWADIKERFDIDLFCGFFMGITCNEGVSLSPDALALLGQRGITFELCIYGPSEE